MPTQIPSQRRRSTDSTSLSGSISSKASAQKRKSMTSMTSASAEFRRTKRIKTEKISWTEPSGSKPVGMVEDSIYDAIVTIKVGEEATSFGVHRGLLRQASKFFREGLASSKAEEDGVFTQVVIMKEEDPEVFRRFKNWLYSDKLISESETYKNLPWEVIIEVYSFAERKGIPRLQNKCVDTVIKKREDGGLFPGQADVNTLWKRTGNFLRFRQLLLDLFATECDLRNATTQNGPYHPQFLQGLVRVLYEMKETRTIYIQVDFWQKRQKYYVDDNQNPIVLD